MSNFVRGHTQYEPTIEVGNIFVPDPLTTLYVWAVQCYHPDYPES